MPMRCVIVAVVEGTSLAEAYRQSHYPRKMKDKTVWEKASRLGAMDKVLARIEELRIVGRETVECDHARWLGEIESMAFFDVRRIVGEDGKFLAKSKYGVPNGTQQTTDGPLSFTIDLLVEAA